MNDEELNTKLKQIDIEDFIWLIYIGIIIMSWYSNTLERKYFIYHDELSKKEYRKTIIIIFTILLIIYLYFLYSSIEDLKKIKKQDSKKKKDLILLSSIASLLIAISGAIFLYIAIKDENLEVELAFN